MTRRPKPAAPVSASGPESPLPVGAARSSPGIPELGHPIPARAVVMASAGTGKTYVLSTRLISALLRPHDRTDPAGILATTFTRKAASEILARVFTRLLEAAEDPAKRAALSNQTGVELDAPACRAEAVALARRMDRVRIMTLDALLTRMARACTTELDVWPVWRIADELEQAAARREAIDAALADEDQSELTRLTQQAAKRPYSSRVHGAIAGLVEQTHATFLSTTTAAWSVIGPRTAPLDDSALAQALGRLASAPIPQTAKGTPDSNYARAVEKVRRLGENQDWDALVTQTLIKGLLTDGRFSRRDVSPALDAVLRPVVDHASFHVLTRIQQRNTATANLLARFEHHLSAARRSTGQLAFEDIPRLLMGAEVDQRLADLWYRLDAALDTLLIDEAQDTSLIQYRLLHPILAELLATDRGVLIVGDVKQSLYAWRQAEAQLLPAIADSWPALQARALSASHRSSPIVLDAVNTVFAGIGSSPALGSRAGVRDAALHFQSQYIAHRAAERAAGLPGFVELRTHRLLDPDAARPEPDLVAGALQGVQDLIRQSGAASATIGVLVRHNKRIAPIIAALREAGIDASQEGGSPVTDDPVVAVVLSLLHLADHPSDSLAAYHVACSPLGPALGWQGVPTIAQARRLASKVRRRLVTRGYAEVIERVLTRLGSVIPPQSADRVDALLGMAREFDRRPSLRPTDFIALVQARRVARASPAPVRVMTIHAAKGLEFDAVVLPDLDARGSTRPRPLLRRASPIEQPTAASIPVPRPITLIHPDLAEMLRQRDQQEALESLCALYVAMTRARRALVMIVSPFDDRRPPDPDTAPRASRILRTALAPGVGAAPPQSTVATTGTATPWPEGLPLRDADVPDATGPARPSAGARPARVRLAPANLNSLRRAPLVAPSTLEGDSTIDLAQRLSSRPGGAAEVGTIAHAMLARLRWLDDHTPTPDDLMHTGLMVPGAQPSAVAQAADIVRSALASPAAAALRRRWHSADPDATLDLRVEWPFLHADSAADHEPTPAATPHTANRLVPAQAAATSGPRLISGIIDRLVIARDPSGRPLAADILDFKTDRLDPNDPGVLTARVEHYRPQLAAYARSVAQMLGLPASSVRAWLVFLASGATVLV